MSDIEEKVRSSLLNPYPQDREVKSVLATTEKDPTFPYRLGLGGIALYCLRQTVEARRAFAASYRAFDVAAGAIAFDAQRGRYAFLFGANVKVDQSGPINEHAEDTVQGKAKKLGYSLIPLLTIVGDNQPDQESGRVSDTLHPCGRCRIRFGQYGLLTPFSTILTADPELSVVQVSDIPGLINYHETGNDTEIETVLLGQDSENWDSDVEPIFLSRFLDCAKTLHVSNE